jgi:hypothetical protein
MKLDQSRMLRTNGLATAAGKPGFDPAQMLSTKGLAVAIGKPRLDR